MSQSASYTVWWFEVDPVTKELKRVYQDFSSKDKARKFQRTKHTLEGTWTYIRPTAELSWHHGKVQQ